MINANIHAGRQTILCQIPESWNEMTGKQLIEVANILSKFEAFTHERDILLVQTLCSLDKNVMRRMDAKVLIEHLLPMIQWVLTGCDLTKQLLPSIRCGKLDFYGPADNLGNLTVGEFDFAERALFQWHIDMDSSNSLFEFLATIYRPAKPGYDFAKNVDGDCRELFNPNTTPYYTKILADNCDPSIAGAVAIWYKGCRAEIVERFDTVFKRPQIDDNEPIELLQGPQYFDLIRAIAKDGTYGSFEDVFKMPLYTALQEMYSVIEESKRIQEQLEAFKNRDNAA